MRMTKQILFLLILGSFLYACSPSLNHKTTDKEQPVVIANDSLEYEIIILDIGFNSFLNTVAKPKGFYSQNYLEIRNRVWVNIWNTRALNSAYNTSIYENQIDYDAHINYGYHVNYMLFNYFIFAQQKYNINLGGGFSNRIR